MGSGGVLIEAKAVSGVTTMTATPTIGPVAVFRATWNLPDGYLLLGVTCANRSGPSVVWAGSAGWTSRLSEPSSHGLKWKSIRCGAKAAQRVSADLEPRLAKTRLRPGPGAWVLGGHGGAENRVKMW